MSQPPVIFEIKEKIAVIKLNRPDNRNSMTLEVMNAFREAVGSVQQDNKLRCLIITGSGSTFCAGADFGSGFSAEENRLPNETLMNFYKPFLEVRRIEIPVIAAMNGHAIGGGIGLALVCDIRIAAKDAKYGATFARLGLHSGMAISYILPRLVGPPAACELLFTGRLINGEKAADMGIANYAVDSDKVFDKAWELAQEIASCAPAAVRMMKTSIYRGLGWDTDNAAAFEAHCQSRTFETEDAGEGINALLEKREPVFKGK
jgi:enoyl-CoA hydratase/carnithine racemase